MLTPILTYVYNRKKTATPHKEAPVELRITYRQKSHYITSGVRLLPKQWRNGTVTNRFDAAELQRTLDTLMANVRDVINKMTDEGDLNTAEIKNRLLRRQGSNISFLEYCRKRTEVRIYGKSEDTADRYDRFLRWLESYGKIVYFADVTDTAILEMDKALAATGMKNYSKWNNYHRFLNSFILDAIDDGHMRRNPYKWLHIKKDKNCGLQKYLSREELARLEAADMPTATLEHVRDLFVFQVYTCLSYVDLKAYSEENATTLDDGTIIYTAKRGKTNQEFTFVLLDKAKKILEKYKGRLPLMTNERYNDYLKVVAQEAKVDKPITSHWARHTGATLLLNHGVDMEVIAKILGHSSTKQTRETYAKLVDQTIAKQMKAFEVRMSS